MKAPTIRRKLASHKGRQELLSLAGEMLLAEGCSRTDVERARALRALVSEAYKEHEILEMEDLVRRNERAAARMENPDAAEPEPYVAEASR